MLRNNPQLFSFLQRFSFSVFPCQLPQKREDEVAVGNSRGQKIPIECNGPLLSTGANIKIHVEHVQAYIGAQSKLFSVFVVDLGLLCQQETRSLSEPQSILFLETSSHRWPTCVCAFEGASNLSSSVCFGCKYIRLTFALSLIFFCKCSRQHSQIRV